MLYPQIGQNIANSSSIATGIMGTVCVRLDSKSIDLSSLHPFLTELCLLGSTAYLSCRIADQRQSTDTRCDFATDTRPQCLKIIQKRSHSYFIHIFSIEMLSKKYFYSKQPNKKLLIKWDFFCDLSTLCEILDSLITRRASTRDIAEIRHLCNSYNFWIFRN